MSNYPNKDALYKAHDECRDAMREFIFEYLEEKVYPETVEELIEGISGQEARDIGIEGILGIFRDRNCWNDYFEERFGYDEQQRRIIYDIRTMIRMVKNARNEFSHPGADDLDPQFTQAHLFIIVDILREINKLDAKRRVEAIRDRLFSDESEEHVADVSDQLETAKTENTELEKQLKDKSDRLEEVEAEWLACEERLETVSTRLRIAVAGKTVAEERLSDISNRLENAEAGLTACKEDLARTLRQLDEAKTEQTEHLSAEERLTRALTESEIEETEKAEYKEDFRVALPTSKEMEQPVLEFLADREEYRRVEIIDFLTEHFSLTDDERRYLSRSGQAERHLMNRNLIERTRTGYYRITFYGLEVLHQNEVYVETPSSPGNTAKAPKSQRKWRHPGAVAALRDPAEIRNAEAKIAKILNPSEKTRLERELREAKQAVYGSVT